MDDHSMRRYVPLLIGGAALIAAACSEPVAAPAAKAPVAKAPVLMTWEPVKMAFYDLAGIYTFTLDPQGGEAKVGQYTIAYDANAVCDPATSGYGPSEWKKSCETLTEPLTITARFWIEDGRAHADFTPDIRFSPNADVTLSGVVPSLRDLELTDEVKDRYSVGYTRVANGLRYFINEAASDPSLATFFAERDGRATGFIRRKLLHFSGYYVRSGRICDDGGMCSDGSLDAVDGGFESP